MLSAMGKRLTVSNRRPLSRLGPMTLNELLPHIRIVTDPKKMALLKAEAARRKRMEEAGDQG